MRTPSKWENHAAKLGPRIKRLRTKQKVSLTRLAEMAGISKSYLHELESGTGSTPSVFIAVDIATALGVSVETLIGLSENIAPPNAIALENVNLKRRLSRISRLCDFDTTAI